MSVKRWLIAGLAIGLHTSISMGQEQAPSAEDIKALRQRIEELEQKVKTLEENRRPAPDTDAAATQRRIEQLDEKVQTLEKRDSELDTAQAKQKERPNVFLSEEGFAAFGVASPEKDFSLRFRAYIQGDARFYIGDNIPINDTFLIRRLRPVIEGTIFHDYDYRVILDVASRASVTPANNSLLQDAVLNAHYWPEFQVQIGKFKPPIGYEHLASDANLLLLERNYPSELVPNREVGIQASGEFFKGSLNYAVGVFNGVFDGGSEDYDVTDDHKDVIGRVAAEPFKTLDNRYLKGVGFAVGGSYGDQNGTLPSFVTTAQQRFFSYASGSGASNSASVVASGRHWRINPEFDYTLGSFGIFGEWVISSQKLRRTAGSEVSHVDADNTAWSVAGSYILTGEPNTLRGVIAPASPFSPLGGGWGAWELVGRLGELAIDDDVFPLYAAAGSARSALSFGVGLNWYLNRNVKVNLNYEQTRFRGGSQTPGTVTAQDEKAFLTRVQFAF